MVLKSLTLQNFRNYSQKEFSFSPGITLVVGPNACGKTNFLEAIYLLASGKSFRAEIEAEMIEYGKQMSNVKCQMSNENVLEIILTRGEINGKKVAKKIYKINGVNKRMMDFVGNLRCVYFGPEDLEIVVGSPLQRRDYLDSVLEQVDREYRRASLSYKKGLRQRNKLLEQIRDEGKPRTTLYFWDKLLVGNGEVITKKREEFIEFVNSQPDYFEKLHLVYHKSIISPQRLQQYAEEEVAAGMTLVGPHRDEVKFQILNSKSQIKRDLSVFGSRGEQRTAVFCLKLAELEFITSKTGQRPILLLDDIFSELDYERRERLLEVIPRQQTIITTTDIHLVAPEARKKMEIIKLEIERYRNLG
ncbi:MAG: DNA replication/repair protein RecF [Microgenomates group bacterium]